MNDDSIYGAYENFEAYASKKGGENEEGLSDAQKEIADKWDETMKDVDGFKDRSDDGLTGAIAGIGEKGNPENPNGEAQKTPSGITKETAKEMLRQNDVVDIDKLADQAGAKSGGADDVINEARQENNANTTYYQNEANNLNANDPNAMNKMAELTSGLAVQAAGAELAAGKTVHYYNAGDIANAKANEAEAQELIKNTEEAAKNIGSVIESQNIDGQSPTNDRIGTSVKNSLEAAKEAQEAIDNAKARRAAAEEAALKDESIKNQAPTAAESETAKEQDEEDTVEMPSASADILNFNAAPQAAEPTTADILNFNAASKDSEAAPAGTIGSDTAEASENASFNKAARETYGQKAA